MGNTRKLTDEQVAEIRRRLRRGERVTRIAQDYEVDHRTIGRIRDWKIYTAPTPSRVSQP